MRYLMGNKGLTNAKSIKNDEFYTQITDIEKELKHYKDHLKNAIVFCNCDDPVYSNFWRYFHLNFAHLGLKKLVATHYDEKEPTYKIEYKGGNDGDISIGVTTPLKQNGDFRSDECIEIMKSSDIIVTNPPFSLFREYVAQLIKYEKKFIIIGNLNAVQNKEFFPYILQGRVWMGATCFNGGATYFVGSKELYDPQKMSNPKNAFIKDDKLYWRVNGVRWYTNLDIKHNHEPLDLTNSYSPEKYPKYENFNAINVDKVYDIPNDYDGFIGVPVSFMDKYCVDQFEIIGLGVGSLAKDLGITPIPKEIDETLPGHSSVWRLYLYKNGKAYVPYGRLIIRKRI